MHGFWVVEHTVRSVGCADLNFETRRFWLRGQDLYKLSTSNVPWRNPGHLDIEMFHFDIF